MKKQKILILSLAMITGLIATGCSHFDSPSDDLVPSESVIDDAVETSDEVGRKVALSATVAENKVNMSSSFGYQILDKKESTMSVRIIAVVDGYKDLTSASVTSKVVAPRSDKATAVDGEETIKEEQTFSVGAVYSSLTDDANISWNGDKPTYTKNYYIIYTLRNVPVAHYFDTIIVKFSATSTETVSQEFIVNAQGIEGENKYVNFEKLDGTTDEYYISGTNDSLINNTEIFVSPDHFTVTDNYAVKDGKITAIGARGFNNSSSHVISNLVLPDTITTLKEWAFYQPCVKKVNIPSSVTTIEASAFYGSSYYAFETLTYKATNLVNDNNAGLYAKNIVVDASVESIPNAFFSASNEPESINYGGTEAEWVTLQNENNKDSGFFALDAVCLDTTYHDVTFHYGEGKLGTVTGDVIVSARNNRTVSNPGSPLLTGKEFSGWFLDSEGNTPYDFNDLVTGPLDIYAVYGTPADGYSLDQPRVITPSSAQNFTATLYPGKTYECIKFTVPTDAGLSTDGDWYYFQVDTDSCIKDSSISGSYSVSQKIEVYQSDKTTKITSSDLAISTANVVQSGYSGPTRIFAKPGDTYYLKMAMSSSPTSYPNYGTLAMKFFTFDNDTIAEAVSMSLDTPVAPNFVSEDQKIIFKYAAPATASLVLKRNEYGASKRYLTAKVYCEDDLTTATSTIVGWGAGSASLDVLEGKTYYIEITPRSDYLDSDILDQMPDYTLTAAPAGYSRAGALDYELGTSETVSAVNTAAGSGYDAGTFYKFTVTDESALYALTTQVGSSSYKQKVIIYDASGSEKKTFESSSAGMIMKKQEVTLTAGDYTMFVGYSSSSTISASAWVDYNFNLGKVAAGDSVNLPADITIGYDADTTLASTTDGKFYRFTADASNFLTIDTSNAGTNVSVSLLSSAGKSLKSTTNNQIIYKTTADTQYIIQISGADADAVLRFSRSDTAETGESAETAYAMSFGADGLMDMTPYATGNDVYFKYTATESGTYKMYFQATLAGAAPSYSSAADSRIRDVYDSTDSSASALTAIVNIDDDKSAHAETIAQYSGYAEYAFEEGKTYYLKLKVPSISSYFDTIKFGIAKKVAGASADMATDLGTIASGISSMTVSMNESGYWSKFTISSPSEMTFSTSALAVGDATLGFYASEASATPMFKITSGEENTSVLLAGTYWIRVIATEGSTETSIPVNVTCTEPSYGISMTYGTGSYSDRTGAPTTAATDSTNGWSVYANVSDGDGVVYTSGQKGVNYGKSALTYTFTEAGTFSFSWAFSGENRQNYDYLYITHTSGGKTVDADTMNGSSESSSAGVDSYSELTWTDVTITVAAGDTITFLYTKDSGSNGDLDAAFIKNVVFTPAAE